MLSVFLQAQARPMQKSLWLTGLLALFSILFFIFISYRNLSSFSQHAAQTQGRIIGFEKQRKVFRPVVEFVTESKDTIRFVASLGKEDTTVVKTGSPVKVLYHPEDPESASLDSFWEIWMPSIMILVFGILPLFFVLLIRYILVSQPSSPT